MEHVVDERVVRGTCWSWWYARWSESRGGGVSGSGAGMQHSAPHRNAALSATHSQQHWVTVTISC